MWKQGSLLLHHHFFCHVKWKRARPEHRGRVRATEQGVGIKLYFGVSQRQSSSPKESEAEMKTKIREELMEEMRKETD